MLQNRKCFFCEADSEVQLMDAIKNTYFVKCPVCGRYEATSKFIDSSPKDMVAAYLYHHEKEKRENSDLFFYFLGEKGDFNEKLHNMNLPMRTVSTSEIKSFFPTKFSDKVDMSLLAIAKKSDYFGNIINITDEEIKSLLFIRRFDEKGDSLPQDQIRVCF